MSVLIVFFEGEWTRYIVHGLFFVTSGAYPRDRRDKAFLECHFYDTLLHVLANCAQKLFGKQSSSFNRQLFFIFIKVRNSRLRLSHADSRL